MKEHNNDIMLPIRGQAKRYPFGVVDLESKSDPKTTQLHIEKERKKAKPDEDKISFLEKLLVDDRSQEGGFERPFLAGFYDGLDFTCFSGDDCIKCMLLFLLQPKFDGMTYYAHNGGAFDWLHLLPLLESLGYSFEIMTVQSKIQCLRVKPHKDSHRKGWTFLDSLQLIPSSLGKITKAFNTDVKKVENFDYNTNESDSRWREYLEDDCVSLYQTLMSFYELVEDALGGEVGMTAAATSMKTFRRSYQSKPIERHSEHHEFFREAYYGGRVEIFRESVRDLKYYDINSAYPFAMLKDMPTGKLTEWEGEPPAWLREGRVGFARADIDMPTDVYIPALPWRNPEGRLIFPVGKFSGVWTAIELDAAIKQGAKVTWKESKWIKSEPIFIDMVNTLYKYRNKEREGYNEALAYVAKIMLNSLYGKFATNPVREKIVYIAPGDEKSDNPSYESVNPEDPECPIYRVEEEIDAPYMAPQIAAHITALARLQLHGFMSEAHKNGILAYCDTDSIQTTADLDYLCASGLGALKDEGEGMLFNGTFLQPKLYSLEGYREGWKSGPWCIDTSVELPNEATHVAINEGEPYEIDRGDKKTGNILLPAGNIARFYHYKVVMKGYRTRTPESFEKIRYGGVISFETLEKIGAMVRKGFKDGPKVIEVSRMIRGEDTKRRHIAGITYPIVIDETIGDISDD